MESYLYVFSLVLGASKLIRVVIRQSIGVIQYNSIYYLSCWFIKYIHISICLGESGQAAIVKGPVTVYIYIYKLFVFAGGQMTE